MRYFKRGAISACCLLSVSHHLGVRCAILSVVPLVHAAFFRSVTIKVCKFEPFFGCELRYLKHGAISAI